MMTSRQKRELLILAIVIVVALAAGMAYRQLVSGGGTASSAAAGARKASPADVVARVNGEEIKRELLEKYYRVTVWLHQLDPEAVPEAMRQRLIGRTLEQIIEERVLASAAASRGVEITPEQVDEMVEEAKRNFETDEEFARSLKDDLGLTVDELKEMLHYQRMAEDVRRTFTEGIEVDESEIDRQLKDYEEILKEHPGGEVEMPSREEVKQDLLLSKADGLYQEWLTGLVATADVEILDMSLVEQAQPQMPPGHPPMGMPEMPEGHPPVEPPAEGESGTGA